MENLYKKIQGYKQPDVVFAKGVKTVFDEKNSTWRFNLKFKNYHNQSKKVAILTAWADTIRIVETENNNEYPGFAGSISEQLPNSYTGKLLRLNDFPLHLEKLTGINDLIIAFNYIVIDGQQLIIQNAIWNGVAQSYLGFESKNQNYRIEDLRAFLKEHPVKNYKITIQSDKDEQFFTNIILGDLIPFTNFQPEVIDISEYRKQNAVQKIVEIPKEYVLNINTVMIVEIASYAETSFTLHFSGFSSQAKDFESRIMQGKAIENILTQLSKP